MARLSLLILAAFAVRTTCAVCVIIDEGEVKEETYTEPSCLEQYVQWRIETSCTFLSKSRKFRVGPTQFGCTNSSFDEIRKFNAAKDTKNHFFVTQSSLGALTMSGPSWLNLTKITLDHCNITQIVPGFLNGFTELTFLSLPHNDIRIIVDGVFSSLTNLVHLNLSFNQISTVESLSLLGLFKLNILDLSNNKIKSLPAKQLFIPTNLTYLDLSNNLLNKMADIGVSALKTVFLMNNNLSSFEFLNGSANSTLIFDVSGNRIQKIENFALFKAAAVNVSCNRLEHLARVAIAAEVNISHNSLKAIANNFVGNSVVALDLSFNLIEDIAKSAFDEGKSLKILRLNDNRLKNLFTSPFNSQENLEYLDLSGNQIAYFEFGVFDSLRNLKFLNVSANLGLIDFQALFRLSQLEELDFERNEPRNLDEFFFETHKKLKTIRMGYKPWNCGKLTKLIHLMETRDINVLRGSSNKTVHVHGIECNGSNLASMNATTTESQLEANSSVNSNFAEYFQNVEEKLFNFFNKTDENTSPCEPITAAPPQNTFELQEAKISHGIVFGNVNLFFCNVFLLLILCTLILRVWLLRKRNSEGHNEQVELI